MTRSASGPTAGRRLGLVLLLSLPGLCAAAAALLPFLGKAFTVDDMTFLVMAEHALRDPLHPSAVDLVFHGVRGRVSAGMVSGPVMSYLLVPLLGRPHAEALAHLEQLALLGLGVAATVSLGLRLGLSRGAALAAGLLVAAAPAVLGMAGTAMPDVPAMAFGVFGVDRLCAFRDRQRSGDRIDQVSGHAMVPAILGALGLALAVLSRPHLGLLWAPAALLLLRDDLRLDEGLRDGPRGLLPGPPAAQLALLCRRLWPLGLGALLAAAVIYAMRDPEAGNDVLRVSARRAGLGQLPSNLISFVVHSALSLPLCLPWAVLRGRRMLEGRAPRVLLGAGLLLPLLSGAWRSLVWLVPLCGVSVLALSDLLLDAWRRRDAVQLALGLWLLLAVPTALYIHLPPKFLVPSAPAAAILVGRQLAAAPRRRALRVGLAATALGLALGVLILHGDQALAEVGRHGGRDLVAREAARGRRVWFDGAWGFQWYAMQAGARPMAEGGPEPAPGDVVVRGIEGHLVDRLPRKRLLERLVFPSRLGVIHSARAGAGFYSNGWGYLPWSPLSDEIGRLEVWLIE